MAIFLAFFEVRRVLLFTSLVALFLTFIPSLYRFVFKREPAAFFDILILIILFGILSFWEIRGVYFNHYALAFLMNFAQAIAIGFIGLTVVYSFFKYLKLEENLVAVSIFSFCLAFAIGTMLEISEILTDYIFNFRIHEAGIFGTTGDLIVYFFALAGLASSLSSGVSSKLPEASPPATPPA